MSKQKILFLVKNRLDSYGISVGLANSVEMLSRALTKFGIENKVVKVVDGNGVDREVHQYKPTICMLEAIWVTPEKIDELTKLHKNTKFIFRVHSKIPFLSGEGFIFNWLWKFKKIAKDNGNLFLSANDFDCAVDLAKTLEWGVLYLPNYYFPVGFEEKWTKLPKPKSDYIDIGSFGAIRVLKNSLEAAVASVIFANSIDKTLRFHINSGRLEQHGEPILRNIRALFEGHPRHELVEWNWLPHSEFLIVANYMDLFVSPSFSETQNICVSDSIFQKVPTVGSVDMDWLPWLYKPIPSDTNDILRSMWLAYNFPKTNVYLCNRALRKYNKEAIKVWLEYMK